MSAVADTYTDAVARCHPARRHADPGPGQTIPPVEQLCDGDYWHADDGRWRVYLEGVGVMVIPPGLGIRECVDRTITTTMPLVARGRRGKVRCGYLRPGGWWQEV